MPARGFHVRRAGEYVRPPGRLDLNAEFPSDDDGYERWLRGAPHHDDPFTGRHIVGQQVRLELVPERFNRYDAQAVAVDFEGARVGYLPAAEAARWHDVLAALNRSAVSVWTAGQIRSGKYDGLRRLTVSLYVPNLQNLCLLADRTGLTGEIERLLAAVSADVRAEALGYAWDDALPRSVVRELSKQTVGFPDLTWPSSPPDGVPRRHGAPGLLTVVLRELVLRERQRKAAARQVEFAARRAQREAEDAAARAERARQKAERARQRQQARALVEQGWTPDRVADEAGVSMNMARTITREVHGPNVTYNADMSAQRLARVVRALALQRQALTRAEIAAELGVGKDSVKALLRDAKFYEEPSSDPTRLELAQAAQASRSFGDTRAQFAGAYQLAYARAVEAWRDATVLFPDVAQDDATARRTDGVAS